MSAPELAWTLEQARAISAPEHALLEANAGTGKTTTVIGKVLWRLGLPVGRDEDGQEIPKHPDPCEIDEIAAITFTEKAAYDLKRKLRQRIEALEDDDRRDSLRWRIDRASIGTIHSFCADLLREHALRLGLDPSFRVMDEIEAQLELDELVSQLIIERLDMDDQGTARLVKDRHFRGYTHTSGATDFVRAALRDLRWHRRRYESWSRDGALDPEALARASGGWNELDDEAFDQTDAACRLARMALDRWERRLADENALDFDSLILLTRDRLLGPQRAGPALASLRQRYRLIVIDEFQDTDFAQRDIAFAIAGLDATAAPRDGPEPPQLFLVGDPKQSIYRFRGADVSVWNDARAKICDAEEPLRLTRNFRSTRPVVDFVNRVSRPAMNDPKLEAQPEAARVEYADLVPQREGDPGAVEWLKVSSSSPTRKKKDGEPMAVKAPERREAEARRIAARLREMVDPAGDGSRAGVEIFGDDGGPRPCRYSDVAVLSYSRKVLGPYEEALWAYGVPYYLTGEAGMNDRLEIMDVVNALRALDNLNDDLKVFAFLRSPFVGLRDEVLTRIKLEGPRGWRPFWKLARDYLQRDDWFEAPEHPEIVAIERDALDRGLRALRELAPLRSRWPLDRLLEELLERTGYRAHLELMEQPASKLANVQRFAHILAGYREHTLSSFLELWNRWEAQDLGIPQAPLYSKKDDVVTLSTIHAAKGLEWPVVFLIDTQESNEAHRLWNTFWSDRELGPIICPSSGNQGPRADEMLARAAAEQAAEKARLLYVATTRARDRLVIAGQTEGSLNWHARWLAAGLDDDVHVSAAVPPVEPAAPRCVPELTWIEAVREAGSLPPLAAPLRQRRLRTMRSATELMTRARSRREWRERYVLGLVPYRYFTQRARKGGLPAWLRGSIVHDVLQFIQELEELDELLDVTIGALESPELEERLRRGSELRADIEREIEGVVNSDEWRWYTQGRHYRELPFVHLIDVEKWHVGAFDLFRPDPECNWIIDFKTHDIGADEADATASSYSLQALLYLRAARALAGDTRLEFHFTRPGVTRAVG
ncbi:MAG: UvrD-helicase domain-containing protein [Gemmatimonadetes bacterium]|uniref:DNA 3'-5' helicase n=1 Tax=Candidatus Kutchimonas denitrificans TaxID=3056748 RepID=A0AAE4Z5T4_9BACT|nr:UvrD-helicase domain-containing protein [Gemmatimonadota bacterium]NIR73558.1 UvrD-helicase domain-containing protein [Candidatus Kutchimonas denitrificans]NIR99517.1 UvrD-helicase domain-containing protein [Gemmatimonadota bacterium]NIT65137.1 UvrD-helicase domain-containing protein [Gemmatimonadota bacterium]NIV23670.1 UvrD-helicase domain-containing protein [Gemmatimonadota bacterium]